MRLAMIPPFINYAAMALALLAAPALAAELAGKPRVVDGDSIEIGGERIELRGIDALEADQTCKTKRGTLHPCGAFATQALKDLIGGQDVACKGEERDEHDALLAVCYIGRIDLNEQMVLQGWALADRRHGDDYARAEEAARRLREGVWKRAFVPPWEWRQGKR